MLEFARNEPVDIDVLAGLFARCGWEDQQAGLKLGWAIAASEEWIVCKLDGELIGFGRSSRLGPVKRVVFDLMVDPRFDHPLVRRRILRMLTESAGRLEEVSVFGQRRSGWSGRSAEDSASTGAAPAADTPAPAGAPLPEDMPGPADVYIGSAFALHFPPAPPSAYLGGLTMSKEAR